MSSNQIKVDLKFDSSSHLSDIKALLQNSSLPIKFQVQEALVNYYLPEALMLSENLSQTQRWELEKAILAMESRVQLFRGFLSGSVTFDQQSSRSSGSASPTEAIESDGNEEKAEVDNFSMGGI